MRTSILTISCIFFTLLLSRELSAQTGGRKGHVSKTAVPSTGGMVVKATVDKQKILIGEPIQLMLECTVPADAPSLVWPSSDSLAHFDWVEKKTLDSVIKPDQRYYKQVMTVTSFDSGAWSIPQFSFLSGNNRALSDSIRIEVSFAPSNSKDFHDIKDIIDDPNPFAKWIGWLVAAFTLLSLALVIWLVRKKKLLKFAVRTETGPRLTPYEEAVKQLEELEKQGLAEGQVKVYYTRLNDILRLFVLRKLNISSLAETNEELIGQLRQLPLDRTVYNELADTLRMSDFVKFAKYQPGLTDKEHGLRVIRQSVDRLNALGQEEQGPQPQRANVSSDKSNSPKAPEEDVHKKV